MPFARQEMLNIGSQGCATKFTFMAAFDGTNNDRDHRELADVDEVTNIAKLASQAEASSKNTPVLTVGYFKGVGTGGDQGGIVNAGVAPSQAIEAAAQSAYLKFRNEALTTWREIRPPAPPPPTSVPPPSASAAAVPLPSALPNW
ncbi:MAG: DUF2235 domain-containing protein [Hydrogenophaga sp.]|nr:DUF2235 domain-containing protein [Hydrogenophaga sp.]